jgi:hypothetical protein
MPADHIERDTETRRRRTMAHDPMDTHVDKAAFWAAYKALQDNGVTLAEVRADVANAVAVAVLDQRTQHGLGRMLEMKQSKADRRSVVEAVASGFPELYTSVTGNGLDAAVQAAANALWGRTA